MLCCLPLLQRLLPLPLLGLVAMGVAQGTEVWEGEQVPVQVLVPLVTQRQPTVCCCSCWILWGRYERTHRLSALGCLLTLTCLASRLATPSLCAQLAKQPLLVHPL